MAALPAWREALARALEVHRDVPPARHVALATVRPDGRPACRTLVFRGFSSDELRLLFATDLRTEKVQQLAHACWAEACWSFPQTREQFRLLGRVAVVGAHGLDADLHAARGRVWQALPEPIRQSHLWPTPGAERAGPDAFQAPAPSAADPSPTFGLLVLEPHEVDHLALREGAPHDRLAHRRGAYGRWETRALNP